MRTETYISRQLQEKLHRVACRLLQDESDAEDAVQDAICNLWSNRIPASSEETRFRLLTILKNVCINKIKKKRLFVDLSHCNKTISSADFDETDRIRTLLLDSLPPLQRQIFQMSAFEDLDYPEIARQLDMTVEAVRMNMSRARKKLREIYNNI